MMNNNYGRISTVDIKIQSIDNRMILKDCYFTSPFKIMNPFVLENGILNVMLMSTSAGIMAGDAQEIKIDVGNGARAQIISQSYEKIHKMDEGSAMRSSSITVGKDACLIYNPQPTIPYAKSAFENNTKIYLKDESSKLIYNEILTSGRVHYGESFNYRYFKNFISIYQNKELTYMDNSIYDPALFNMSGYGMYEGYTHFFNQVICNFDNKAKIINEIRALLSEYSDIQFGVSDTYHNDIVVRVFACEGDLLEKISQKIINVIL